VNEDAPFCSDANPTVPAPLSAIVAKMLNRDPDRRYQTPGEVVAELQRSVRGERPLAYTRMLAAHEVGPFSSRPPEVFGREGRGTGRRAEQKPRRLLRKAFILLLIGALAYGAWYAKTQRHLTGPGQAPGSGSGSGPETAAVGEDASRVTMWFDLANPDGVAVAENGSFPLEFNAGSRIRFRVKPNSSSYVYIFLVTKERPSGLIQAELLSGDSGNEVPLLADTLTPFPDAERFYSLPASAESAVFLVATVQRPAGLSRLRQAMGPLAAELAGQALSIPKRQTLWFGYPEQNWTTSSGHSVAAAGLDTVIGKLRAAFGSEPPRFFGAAVSWE
jgi:hypothetical protein